MSELAPDCPTFKLLRYNPRRRARGVEAAEVLIQHDDEDGDQLLWMNQLDITNNIRAFGPHPGLLAAQAAYKANKEFPERIDEARQ